MIETVTDYNSFWLIIFASIVIVAVGCIVATVVVKLKNKDTDIFFKSNDNAKEVTLDNNKTHLQVIDHLPPVYEKELHSLEKNNKKILEMLESINQKLDIVIENVTQK